MDLQLFSWLTIISWNVLVFLCFLPLCVFSLYAESNLLHFLKITKKSNILTVHLRPVFNLTFDFSKYCPFKVSRHCWNRKFFSVYSSFLLRIPRICGKNWSVYGEYGKFRAVCGIPNYLRIRGKNLCVHGEDTQQNIKDKQHIKIGNTFFGKLVIITFKWAHKLPEVLPVLHKIYSIIFIFIHICVLFIWLKSKN